MNEPAPAKGRPRSSFWTTCGRELAVSSLKVDCETHAIERITLSISRQSHDDDRVWASLTPEEARRLAQWLLAQAG
jgi:putative redox protein